MLVPEQVSVVHDLWEEEKEKQQLRNNGSVMWLALVPPQGKYIAIWYMSLSPQWTKAPT